MPQQDRAMMEHFQVPLMKGLFGVSQVRREDVLRALEGSGCDAQLRQWLERKARPVPRREVITGDPIV